MSNPSSFSASFGLLECDEPKSMSDTLLASKSLGYKVSECNCVEYQYMDLRRLLLLLGPLGILRFSQLRLNTKALKH